MLQASQQPAATDERKEQQAAKTSPKNPQVIGMALRRWVFAVVGALVLWRFVVPVQQCVGGSRNFTARWLPWGWSCPAQLACIDVSSTLLRIVMLVLIGVGVVWVFRPVKAPSNET